MISVVSFLMFMFEIFCDFPVSRAFSVQLNCLVLLCLVFIAKLRDWLGRISSRFYEMTYFELSCK